VAKYEIHQSTILKRAAAAAGYQEARCKLRSSVWQFVPAGVTIPLLALDLAASTSGLNQPPILLQSM
jgi:hypothetical protein